MDGFYKTSFQTDAERSKAMQEAINDLISNFSKLAPVPYYKSKCRRTTMAARANNLPGFYVIYDWGHGTHELHVHYKKNGNYNKDYVKVSGKGMKGGQTPLNDKQVELIKTAIAAPPSA
jgi:hypothetical protein